MIKFLKACPQVISKKKITIFEVYMSLPLSEITTTTKKYQSKAKQQKQKQRKQI